MHGDLPFKRSTVIRASISAEVGRDDINTNKAKGGEKI
jgi:hypothetical protein